MGYDCALLANLTRAWVWLLADDIVSHEVTLPLHCYNASLLEDVPEMLQDVSRLLGNLKEFKKVFTLLPENWYRNW